VDKYLEAILTKDELQRIFSKITVEPATKCWNWTAAKLKNRGYGVFNFRGKTEMVHRLMYAHFVKPIPKGVGNGIPIIDHIVCNNRSCCNPSHLKLSSQGHNVLRGNSPPAINYRKTHCINGHALPATNNKHERKCVICRRINATRRYHLHKKDPQFMEDRRKRSSAFWNGPRHKELLEKHRISNIRSYHKNKPQP